MDGKDDVAKRLAQEHFKIEPGLQRVLRLSRTDGGDDLAAEPIMLLEVNADTIATGIQPLHFGPAPAHGITCSSVIIEVTPDEFRQIQDRTLRLPSGWELGEELPKPATATGAD